MSKLNGSLQESAENAETTTCSNGVFFIDPTRATASMAESLEELRSSLLCPICNNLMKDPTTLSCTHSFCMDCISNQKAWTCVMPGCNMPVTLRGKKSYIVNPQLSSVLSSLEVIQKTINSARPEWWKCSSYSQTMMSQHFAGGSPDVPSNSYVTGAAREESSSDEEDEDKVVSFNFERNLEKYSDNDEDDEDSDATTLGDEKDEDSFLTPILKRRKRNDSHRTAQIVKQNMDNNGKTGERQQKSGKDSTLDADVSLDINPASGNVLDSHTPQSDNLNKSCLLPDVSFHASPIAKESSQVESQSQLLCQSPFMKKTIDDLKEGRLNLLL
jgi:RING-finger-containing E3 ubiquitin ligase